MKYLEGSFSYDLANFIGRRIDSRGRRVEESKEFRALSSAQDRIIEALKAQLPKSEENKRLFFDLENITNEMVSMLECDTYLLGLRDGLTAGKLESIVLDDLMREEAREDVATAK